MADEKNREGRGVTVESGPESQAMQFETETTTTPAALPADMRAEEEAREVDDRAADDAEMDVRRREHSSS